MFLSSNRILRNRKLLDAVSYKVKDVSYLHSCNVHRILNGKRILNLTIDHRHSAVDLKLYGTRLISTNIGEILSTTDTIPSEPAEAVSNSVVTSSTNNPSQNVQKDAGSVTSTSNQTDVQTVQPDGVISEFPIPDPPTPPTLMESGSGIFNGLPLGEPPFEHLGLGGWTPVGLIQHGFEHLHVSAGLPWWESIFVATIIARVVLFPIIVLTQRNAARMSNYLPTFQELQIKVNDAKQRGEPIEAARYTQDLLVFMKEKKINPIKNAAIPLVQAPVFISFFMALREMANLPVKSMHNEGLFWFTDLTVPDQYYILPVLTSLTMWLSIEVGADTGRMTSSNHHIIKYIMRFMPIVVFPFTLNFPGAILIYWVTTNSISLMLAGLFKAKRVRRLFKIEDRVVHSEDKLPVKNIGFIKGIKKWWKETKTQGALEERNRKHAITFSSAGRGAIPKTYKYNPTLPRTAESSTATGIQAKKFS